MSHVGIRKRLCPKCRKPSWLYPSVDIPISDTEEVFMQLLGRFADKGKALSALHSALIREISETISSDFISKTLKENGLDPARFIADFEKTLPQLPVAAKGAT